jgi:hypothetical protein
MKVELRYVEAWSGSCLFCGREIVQTRPGWSGYSLIPKITGEICVDCFFQITSIKSITHILPTGLTIVRELEDEAEKQGEEWRNAV